MNSPPENFYVVSRASYYRDPHRQPCDGAFHREDTVPAGQSIWLVEIPSLREFIKEEGDCVISLVSDKMNILIYDMYIE